MAQNIDIRILHGFYNSIHGVFGRHFQIGMHGGNNKVESGQITMLLTAEICAKLDIYGRYKVVATNGNLSDGFRCEYYHEAEIFSGRSRLGKEYKSQVLASSHLHFIKALAAQLEKER